MTIELSGPRLAVETCSRRLEILQVLGHDQRTTTVAAPGTDAHTTVIAGEVTGSPGEEVRCDISWHGPAEVDAAQMATEATVQAMSGLMYLHGLEVGQPRRLGLEVASVAAGLLASQGVIASLIAGHRGHHERSVATSALEAAFLLESHYVARATSSSSWGDWAPMEPGPAAGPPFPTSDGRWVELETTSVEAWRSLWTSLGVDAPAVSRAWSLFVSRYSTARCSMPHGFHEATAKRTVAELSGIADRSRVSLCVLRQYDEILAQAEITMMGSAIIRSGPQPEPSVEAHRISSATCGDGAGKTPRLPLEGIRVVEATSRIQGPLAGHLLGMLGADVTRIEPPGGDVARMEDPIAGDAGAFFLSLNRNKQSVEIDLGRSPGRSELVELAGSADVFLQNWRPGKAEQWGLEYNQLSALNPRLIYAHASGWRNMAEFCPPVGMEYMVQAYSGLGQGINPHGSLPFPSRMLLSDVFGGLVATEGILAALLRRERNNNGCMVDSSLLDGAMAMQAHVLNALGNHQEEGRFQGRPLWGPLDRPIETAYGFLVLGIKGNEQIRRLGETFGGIAGPNGSISTEAMLVNLFTSDTAAAWEQPMLDAGVPYAVACTDLASLPGDPRFERLFEPLGGSGHAPCGPWRFS